MSPYKKRSFVPLVCLAAIGFSIPSAVVASTCPWGGDSSQSIRCFDCMKRASTPQGWKLVNTCKRPPPSKRANRDF